MNAPQNKNRLYVMSIICIGIITSVWLFSREPNQESVSKNEAIVSTVPYSKINTSTSTEDWQKILTVVDLKDQSVTNVLSGSDLDSEDDTTITAQLSRDLFARYLNIANKPDGVTTSDANKIASDVLSNPMYTKASGAIYLSSNLNITDQSDIDTIRKYNTQLVQKMNARSIKGSDTPLSILIQALQTEKEKDLLKINPFISLYKGVISDLLSIQVPKNAIKAHLALLNAYSNILSATESMQVILADPIKGAYGISKYQNDIENLQKALDNINLYFTNNLKLN